MRGGGGGWLVVFLGRCFFLGVCFGQVFVLVCFFWVFFWAVFFLGEEGGVFSGCFFFGERRRCFFGEKGRVCVCRGGGGGGWGVFFFGLGCVCVFFWVGVCVFFWVGVCAFFLGWGVCAFFWGWGVCFFWVGVFFFGFRFGSVRFGFFWGLGLDTLFTRVSRCLFAVCLPCGASWMDANRGPGKLEDLQGSPSSVSIMAKML